MTAIGAATKSLEVLLVEDNPGDLRLTQEAFREAIRTIHLHVAADDAEVLPFSSTRGFQLAAFESLVISINDWLTKVNMPRRGPNE